MVKTHFYLSNAFVLTNEIEHKRNLYSFTILTGAEFEAMVCVSIDSSGRFWLQLARDKAGDNAFNFFKKQLQ